MLVIVLIQVQNISYAILKSQFHESSKHFKMLFSLQVLVIPMAKVK